VTSWIRRETITRHRPTRVSDGHGNQITSWAASDDLPIPGCLFAPGTSDEVEGVRDALETAGTVYAPPAVDVVAFDAVTVRGAIYKVTGNPQEWPAGTVIRLTRWEG
jgi:hypothetical protein